MLSAELQCLNSKLKTQNSNSKLLTQRASVTDKILATIFPISAFVACGFEHSIANMYFLPVGMALAAGSAPIALSAAVTNLVLVTIGNIIGGTLLVALVYWFVYLRGATAVDELPSKAVPSTAGQALRADR